MKKVWGWAFIVVMSLTILFIAIRFLNQRADTLDKIASGEQETIVEQLNANTPVFINFEDEYFHRRNCPFIRRPAEQVIYSQALAKGLKPCPNCLPAEE